jgi:hypothetical protein
MNKLALTLPGGENIQAPSGVPGSVGINTILQFALTWIFTIAVIATLFFLILGGIGFITSGGDKQKVVQARQRLTFAVVGLIVIFLSFFIVNLIGGIFGVNLLNVPGQVDPCLTVPRGQPC